MFGLEETNRWGSMVWGVDSWGWDATLPWNLRKLVSTTLTVNSDMSKFSIIKGISDYLNFSTQVSKNSTRYFRNNTMTVSGGLAAVYWLNNGWYYAVDGINATNWNTTNYTETSTAVSTWSSVGPATTTWS
jgi:hypothetical protein